VRFYGLDQQPFLGVSCANLFPVHVRLLDEKKL